MTSGQKVTLKTLADELELNVSTVSRVINAAPDEASKWASAETVQRIKDLATLRGYARNPYAASLRTSHTDLIGVIVPRLQDYVLATIYGGIDEAAGEAGMTTVVANSLDKLALQGARVDSLLARRADGLIFGDAHLDSPFLDDLAKRGVPLTLVSRRKPGHVSVTCDDVEGGSLAGRYLLSKGYSKFAVIAGPKYASTTIDRVRGFIEVLNEAGISGSQIDVHNVGFDAQAGRKGITDILDQGSLPEAVFVINDFAAIGAIGVLQSKGFQIPDDIAVVGYNDIPIAEAVNLTTIRSPLIEMGQKGLQKLRILLGGQETESELLTPELVLRATA